MRHKKSSKKMLSLAAKKLRSKGSSKATKSLAARVLADGPHKRGRKSGKKGR